MNEKITLEINTEFEGNALDFALTHGNVFNFRRTGGLIRIAVTPGPMGTLTAAEAEEIARNLLAASALAQKHPTT